MWVILVVTFGLGVAGGLKEHGVAVGLGVEVTIRGVGVGVAVSVGGVGVGVSVGVGVGINLFVIINVVVNPSSTVSMLSIAYPSIASY